MKNIICALLLATCSPGFTQTVSTVAGTAGVIGNANGQGTSASFNNPHGIAIDRIGNLFVADRFGHTIRKITPSGMVSTFAGAGVPGATDGNGTSAYFNEPWAVSCDTLGNVYVADTKNYKVRKISSSGDVTTLAGTGVFGVTNGTANLAQFGFPTGIAVNGDGSTIYVCDRMTNTIRLITSGTVSTVAGAVFSPGFVDGPGTSARFDHPHSLALDATGNLLIADEFNNRIRMLTPAGNVSTIAGNGISGTTNGPALNSSFNAPWGLCTDASGNIFIGDANNFTVRKISSGQVSLYAGQEGMAGMTNGPALQSITLATSTGATSFCVGTPVTILSTPSNLSNYTFREGTTILGTSPNGVITLSGLTAGTHAITCTATNTSGQLVSSNTLIITITQGLTVTINVTGNTTICQGDSVTLTASPAGNYLWSNGATTQSVNVTTAGMYTVTVTDVSGCSGSSSPVEIITLQPPAATVSSSTNSASCPGDTVTLTAGSANNYTWSNGATSQSINVTVPGNYTVIVSNGTGCSAISFPTTVAFHPLTSSLVTPSGNVLIPQGATTTLTANSGTGYIWSNGSTTQSITVGQAGVYVVTVTDTNGCKSTPDTAQVSLLSTSNMIIVNGPTSFCDGDSVMLTSAFTNYNQWFMNGALIVGATQPQYTAKVSGIYQVQYAAPSQAPVMSDSVDVTVYTIPNSVSAQGDSICKNESAILSVNPQQGITYNWFTTPAGGTSQATGLSYVTPPLTQSTLYYIELSNSFGCVRSNRFIVPATVLPATGAGIYASEPITGQGGIKMVFFTDLMPGFTYYWDFGDPGSANNNSGIHNPEHTYSQPGAYNITLMVTNQFGCTDTIFKTVLVTFDENLFIPSGFTPNGDGNNDIFRVRGNNISYSTMSIFNQWGQRIWHSPKETIGWDGNANGAQVPSGTYAYAIEVHLITGEKIYYRGNINVIR